MNITSGSRKIAHKVIWFLEDIKGFSERKLYIFESKETNKRITILCETSLETGEKYIDRNSGKKANEIIERERTRILFTSDDIKVEKGKPCGWIYGENKELHDRKGNVIGIKHFACDFYGQKQLLE